MRSDRASSNRSNAGLPISKPAAFRPSAFPKLRPFLEAFARVSHRTLLDSATRGPKRLLETAFGGATSEREPEAPRPPDFLLGPTSQWLREQASRLHSSRTVPNTALAPREFAGQSRCCARMCPRELSCRCPFLL